MSSDYFVPAFDTFLAVAALSAAFITPDRTSSTHDDHTDSYQQEHYAIAVNAFDDMNVAVDNNNESEDFIDSPENINKILSATTVGSPVVVDYDDPFTCVTHGSCTTRALFWGVVTLYVTVTVLKNLFLFYRFVMAWNLIVYTRRMDMPRYRPAYHENAQCYRAFCFNNNNQCRSDPYERLPPIHRADMEEHMSCPICLGDFYEGDFVTECEDGCGMWFHKECLFEWLDRRDTCPCCRLDMFKQKSDKNEAWLWRLGNTR